MVLVIQVKWRRISGEELVEYKTCTNCGKPLPATLEFYSPSKQTKDGFYGRCKICHNKRNVNYYKKNSEKINKRARKYYQNNAEVYKTMKQNNREWRKNNLDKMSALAAKYRARKLNQTPNLTQEEEDFIELIYKKSQELGKYWQVDHIIPLSKGGLHCPDNLQIVTREYNQQKSDKLNFRLPTDKEIYRLQ